MHGLKRSSLTLAVGAALAALGSRSLAAPPTGAASAAVIDVVRVGDGQLSCAELAGEINQLSSEVLTSRAQAERTLQAAQASAESASMARRVALGGLVHASSFIPFGGGMAALAARSMALNAAGAVAQAPVAPALVAAPLLADSPASQRLALLKGLFQRKTC